MKNISLVTILCLLLTGCEDVQPPSTAGLADNMRGILTESLDGIILPGESGGTLFTCATAEPVTFADPKGILKKALADDSIAYGLPIDGVLKVAVSKDGEGFDLKDVESINPSWWETDCAMVQRIQGLGNEPGWEIRIDPPKEFVLSTNYGMDIHRFPYVLPDVSSGIWTYQVAIGLGDDAERISITVEEKPCGDTMADQAFPYTVSVSLNDTQMTGCGRPLSDAPPVQ